MAVRAEPLLVVYYSVDGGHASYASRCVLCCGTGVWAVSLMRLRELPAGPVFQFRDEQIVSEDLDP